MAVIDINWNPGRRELRQFAVTWLGVFGLVGVLVAWRGHAFEVPVAWARPWAVPLFVWTLGGLVGLTGLVAPMLVKPVYRGSMAAAFPIGWFTSHVLLALTYFGLFTLVSLIFRIVGRDPLHRRFDREAPTYWIRRAPAPGLERYFKQF